MSNKTVWRLREDWTYDDYSLNIRLYVLAGNQAVADRLTAVCRDLFQQEPDLRPQPGDNSAFRETFGKRVPKGVTA